MFADNPVTLQTQQKTEHVRVYAYLRQSTANILSKEYVCAINAAYIDLLRRTTAGLLMKYNIYKYVHMYVCM